MVTVPEAHDVAVTCRPGTPPGTRKVAIHRYLDAGFVAQFQADASSAPGNNASLFDWEQEDRMPSSQGSLLKLRRPVHRTFHVVAWEASCKLPTAPSGQPPIAPEKIASAGFVVRMGDAKAPQGFQITKGKPRGWASVEPCVDPDAARQVKALGLVPRQATPSPGYTGEETFSAASARGAGRRGDSHVAVRLPADRWWRLCPGHASAAARCHRRFVGRSDMAVRPCRIQQRALPAPIRSTSRFHRGRSEARWRHYCACCSAATNWQIPRHGPIR